MRSRHPDYRAYRKVREAVARILAGASSGAVIADELEAWHRELFMPCVDAGLTSVADLSGYRRTQVYIAGSRYTPPSAAKVPDAMGAFLDLIRTKSEPLVQAILGHFFFVHIHPYADGNGRTARFIMNAALVSSGFAWKVIPVEQRREYMSALETASVYGDISDFAEFVIGSSTLVAMPEQIKDMGVNEAEGYVNAKLIHNIGTKKDSHWVLS